MKKLNFEQMEKLSAGIEVVNTLTKNQQCLALGGLWVISIALGAVGGVGWAATIGISAVAIVNC